MNITYWTGYSKKKNSTAQPTSGTDATVTLKDDCSILNPVFDCSGVPDNVNYIYVSNFGRYYFVSDVVHITADRIQIHCSVDVLASYKSQIGGYTANVEFAASSSNIYITDPRNKPTYVMQEKHSTLVSLTNKGFDNIGCFIVGIISNQGLNYYVLSESDFTSLCQILFDLGNANQLSNNFYDLANCIVSAVWSTYIPSSDILASTVVTIGGDPSSSPIVTPLELGIFNKITQRLDGIDLGTLTIPFPSDDHNISFSYLDLPPFTTGEIYLPYVGCVPLDLDIFAPFKSISIKMAIDHYTGDIVYSFHNISGDMIASYQGNCATNIPISSRSYNAIGKTAAAISAIGGAASIIAGIASENVALAGSGVTALANAAISNYQSGSVHTHTNGSLSSAVSSRLSLDIISTVSTRTPTTWDVSTEFKNVSGMPYYKAAQISSLSGYIQCSGASVAISGYDTEKDAVNGYLNSGFYYE